MVRLITADGVELAHDVGPECELATALTYARETTGDIEAVQGRDGERIRVDWLQRIATRPEAIAALGTAHSTRYIRSIVARILRVVMDTGVVHITGGAPLVMYPKPAGGRLEAYEVAVLMAGKPPLMCTIALTNVVGSITLSVFKAWRCSVALSRDGHTLHPGLPVAAVFGQQRSVTLQARELHAEPSRFDVVPSLNSTTCSMACRDGLHTESPFGHDAPTITAQLRSPICWTTRGATHVWRQSDFWGAVRVASLLKASNILPLLLGYLSLPPDEWLRGSAVPGRTTMHPVSNHLTGALDTVKIMFTPDVPIAIGSHMRLKIDAHPCGMPCVEWFVVYSGM